MAKVDDLVILPPELIPRNDKKMQSMKFHSRGSLINTFRPFWIWSGLAGALSVLLLWYQFGFSLGGMIEEYDLLRAIAQHPNFWNSFPGNPMSESFAARPFQITPFYIAHAIDSRSFFGFHILLIVACFLKVIAGASIGYFLFRNRMYAAAMGMLFLMFPADTQQMSFRTINISVAIALMMCSVALAMRGVVAASSMKRWAAMAGSVICSVIAVLIYEPMLFLYALPPLLLFARYGFWSSTKILRNRRKYIVAWLVGPLLNVVYLYYAIAFYKSAYQIGVTQGGTVASILRNSHYLIESGAYRVFYESWVSSWQLLAHGMAHYRFLVLAAVAIFVMFALLARIPSACLRAGRLYRYIFVGLVASVIAYLPFMVSEAHMVITQRTFMGVALGASFIFVSVIARVFRRRAALGGMVLSGFIFLGLIGQLYQFDQYTRMYTGTVRPYMSLVADQSDAMKKIHLVFDSSGLGGHMGGMFYSKVQNGPAVRRGDSTSVYILCMDERLSQFKVFSNCELSDGVWTITGYGNVSQQISASDVQVIKMADDFNETYRSTNGTWHDLGSFSQEKSIFLPLHGAPESYVCVADSDWGYSRFCRGSGWADGMLDHGYFKHDNFFIAMSPDASFLFSLTAAPADYVLQVETLAGISPDILSGLKVLVNGHPVEFKVEAERFIKARVMQDYVLNGRNQILLSHALAPGKDIGLYVKRVDFAPFGSEGLPVIGGSNTYPVAKLGKWYVLKDATTQKMLQTGFSGPEPDGTWTDGNIATIRFTLPQGSIPTTLQMETLPFLSDTHSHLEVEFSVDGEKISTQTFNAPAQWHQITLPLGTKVRPGADVTVLLTIRDPAKPGTQDQRNLGLKVRQFQIR
ncbi:hypothetical protein ACX3YC_26030 [Pseudomonas mohnii]